MNDLEVLQSYRYAQRELEMLRDKQEDYPTPDMLSLLEDRCCRLGEHFEAILQQVRDPRMRTILRCYYGLALTDDRIGESLSLNGRTVNRLRNRWAHAHSKH